VVRQESRRTVPLHSGIIFTAILAACSSHYSDGPGTDGVPPAQPTDEAQAGRLLQMLQTFAETPRPIHRCDQEQANNYLASSIVPDGGDGSYCRRTLGGPVIIKPGQWIFSWSNVSDGRFI
jgi:hypothetical protein